jgi:hypothetical protein
MILFDSKNIFYLGFSLWFIALILLVVMQIGLQIKYGYTKCLLKDVTGVYLKLAKYAGLAFLLGTFIVLIGMIIG